MNLEKKKIKVLSKCFNIPQDKVSCLLDAYLALTLYNIQSNGSDDTILGEVEIDREHHQLKVIDNTDKINQILNGNVDLETFKQFILLGDFNI